MSSELQPGTSTAPGLHDFVLREILPQYSHIGGRALDLGAGTGALAERLRHEGLKVLAADISVPKSQTEVPFAYIDLNQQDFASELGPGSFDLITSIEVIEHVENPIGFLRNIGRLLSPSGVAIITTPNVDSTPARLKFLFYGTIRMMDSHSEKTHITPIFWDLFTRQYLPRSELQLLEHYVYPGYGYRMTRRVFSAPMRLLSPLLRGACLQGDNHVIVLGRNGKERQTRRLAGQRQSSP